MTSSVYALIVGFIVIPTIGFAAAILYVRSGQFRSLPLKVYKASFLGRSIVVSSTLLVQGSILVLLYSWLNMFFPFALAAVAAAMAAMSLLRVKKVDSPDIGTATEQLLARLSQWQKDMAEVKQHVEAIQYDVLAKQIELDEKERIRQTLDKEISEKSEEAQIWGSMTKEQKDQFLKETVAAMKQESRGTFWLGLFLGFLLNILATATWTLMGNPGRTEMIQKIEKVSHWINGNTNTNEPNKASEATSEPAPGAASSSPQG